MPTIPATVAVALNHAQRCGLDRLDAQLLLLHACGRTGHDRAWVLAHTPDALDPSHAQDFMALIARRAAGEPLAYITGHKEFFGLDLQVTPATLIPRPDTETLVEWALDLLQGQEGATVADLGTGSGAIALALKAQRPDLLVHAVDISEAALHVARGNASRLGLQVQFHQGSWCSPLPTGLDLIVSNPPYIAEGDPHLPALRYEPLAALVSADNGMADVRALIAQAHLTLRTGGWLLLEHGNTQANTVRQMFTQAGWHLPQSRKDLAGIERCTGAQRP